MSPDFARAARLVAGAALAAGLVAPASVHAATTAVFGGSTAAAEPIALTADAKAKRLRSVTVVYEAKCSDGEVFPFTAQLSASSATSGFGDGTTKLRMSRNKRGRFAGSNIALLGDDTHSATAKLKLKGRLRSGSAKGTLSATVLIVDMTSGQVITCRTGATNWRASRSPGRVYAGATDQGEPVVVRLDSARTKVSEMLIGWESSTCQPEGFIRVGDGVADLPITDGHFGDSFSRSFTDDSGAATLDYVVDGTIDLAGRSATGTFQVKVTGKDAAGATTLSCDTGVVTWRATTG